MKKPIRSASKTTTTSTPNALSAQISRIRVHQRPIVHPDGPRINADAADLHAAAGPRPNEKADQVYVHLNDHAHAVHDA